MVPFRFSDRNPKTATKILLRCIHLEINRFEK
jgi:hypothetical protein